jgi:hypothetical protein
MRPAISEENTMDDSGRLHMPGFVGKTFEETGVKKGVFGKVATSLIADEIDESARAKVEGAELRGAMELGGRKSPGGMKMSERIRAEKQFAR